MQQYAGLDKLIEPLRATIQSKAKANSVKQEFEKQDELKRSAMRAIAALLTIPDSGMYVCVCLYVCVYVCVCMIFYVVCACVFFYYSETSG